MFGIHVNTQALVTFLDIGTCTTCLRMYRLRTIHTLRRYNDSSGSMILVHIILWYYRLVLLPAACCRSRTFVCAGQETLACSRCVVVYLWSYFNETFCNCPFGYGRGVFFSSIFSFFRHVLLRSQPWICIKQKKTTARLIRVIRVHIRIYTLRIYYQA